MSLEHTILGNIVFNEEYARKVIPFLKEEYFHDPSERRIYNLIDKYISKYNRIPTQEVLSVDLNNIDGVPEEQFKSCQTLIKQLSKNDDKDIEWLLDTTEEFCKDKALYNAILESIKIVDGKEKDSSIAKGAIPKLLSDALGVSFDTAIGHDFLDDYEKRYEFYHSKEYRIPFKLEYFNKITKGGLPRKTINICLAGTGTGKSLFMCDCAANNLLDGLNVLYITLEMSEEKIAERIDANLLNITIDDLIDLPKSTYEKLINTVKGKTTGKLVIKEYPTSSAGSANFRHLLNELKLKRNFVPDIIYIDYLNICNSSRLKQNSNVNSYTFIKAIAEELRGLAVEFNVPIVSATQTTRSGYGNSDVELTDTSESFGLPATADMMFALIASEEMDKKGQIMVKQLKNRYDDIAKLRKFVIGIDRAKMTLYDVEESAQDLSESVFDSTPSGAKLNQKFSKNKFEDFK